MEKEIDTLWNQLKEASGEEQRKLFVDFCSRLVIYKEEGKLSEEEAAYKIVGAIQFGNLSDFPECNAIFDIAATVELPRTISYAQPIGLGTWDKKTADKMKQKEWKELVAAVESVEQSLQPPML